MSRNANSRFAMLPRANIQRSKFKRDSNLKTAFNSGFLVPIYHEKNVLPGDTHSLRTTFSIRMSTPIHPTMDDAFIDIYYFFVPHRLVWPDFERFIGDNNGDYWNAPRTDIREPHLIFSTSSNKKSWPTPEDGLHTLYDYFGLPLMDRLSDISLFDSTSCSISALPFRAYCKIWNDWFRSEVTDIPVNIPLTSTDENLLLSSNQGYIGSAYRGGELCPVSKFHDYFTSALLSPQRGPDVLLPLGSSAPVVTSDTPHDITADTPVKFSNVSTGSEFSSATSGMLSIFENKMAVNSSSNLNGNNLAAPNNLIADLSLATSASINQLREALALQNFYEKNARYGTRYTEILRGHFGVQSPDSRLQRPEYIGGKRVRLNMQQVLQTGSTNETSPQGNTAAFSWTVDSSDSFTYSAVEHGQIIGLACVRTMQTYQYGIERSWRTRDTIDYYWPSFAHIGEQPIYNYEIYAQGTSEDTEVFGYQEAYADYRYKPSRVTGVLRSNASQSLDVWHYAEKLESLPTLSSEFMHQSQAVIDRTLAVSSELQPQFIADFDFNMTSVRPMPMYSIPGLGYHF